MSGSEYAEATTAMMIVTPTILIAGISNITGIQVLIPLGYERFTVISTFGGAFTDLILNMIFIPEYGAAGAALGTLVAEIVVLLIQLIFMKREKLTQYLKVDWRNSLKICGGGGLAGVCLHFLIPLITIGSNFVKLLLFAFCFFAVYLFVLAISKETIFWNYGIKTVSNIVGKITKRGKNH